MRAIEQRRLAARLLALGLCTIGNNVVAQTLGSLTLPDGQQRADIGAPAIPGSAVYSGGLYAISAGGSGLFGGADQFHFVYQPLTGDGEIIARIRSIVETNTDANAAVMIREALTAGARHATMTLAAGSGFVFLRRFDEGGGTAVTSGGDGRAPGWVRLVRSGDRFEAYRSADGIEWTLVGSDTITMGATVYAGLAVTSHNAAAATGAQIDSVRITAAPAPAPDPIPGESPDPPRFVLFTASPDHSTAVDRYELEVFTPDQDPATATPAAVSDLGKPAPDASNEITADQATFFSALPPGTYIATVKALGPGGSSRSMPVTFTR